MKQLFAFTAALAVFSAAFAAAPANAQTFRELMEDIGVHQFVEFGGKVLGPMVKRSASGEVEVTSVISMDDVEALLKTL